MDLREPATAVAYAKRAVDKSGAKDREVIELLARAYFANRDPAHAAETEQIALNLSRSGEPPASPQIQREIESRLAKFREAGKLAAAGR
jgi:hypothetical protein